MKRTASLTLQVDVLRTHDRDAIIRIPGIEQEVRVPLSALELDDPYAGWSVKTITGTTPANGAVICDHAGRPRVRFYSDDPEVAAELARDHLEHLRDHFPGGV